MTQEMLSIQFLAVAAHLVGDYFLQSDWMALNKKKSSWACLIHVVLYTVPFAFLTESPLALGMIMGTHFLLDRSETLLPRFIWLKNYMAPPGYNPPWEVCKKNMGFRPVRPLWITVWLAIIMDNTLHLIINGMALAWL